MENNFILLNKEKDLYLYFNTYIYNSIPKNYKILKNNILDEIYHLIKNTTLISVNKGNIRNKYVKDSKSSLIIIDFYLSCINDLQLIKNRRFLSIVNKLNEINKIINKMELNNA